MKKALVLKSTGSWYALEDLDDGSQWNGRVRGKLRIDSEIRSSNPIAVGDVVFYEIEDDTAKVATIHDVQQRSNYIIRVSPQNRHKKHILASNLDAAMMVCTLADPKTSEGFIDRFLLTAQAYHIPGIVVVNKMDLLQEKHRIQLAIWEEVYKKAGYQVFTISALQPQSLAVLKSALKGKKTLISGHSGVGKSTLINALIPHQNLRTGDISAWSGKGQHTTTFAEMIPLPEGGYLIDTPGVKEFGLMDIQPSELAQYFPEIRELMHQCRYTDCMHIKEPGCAVLAAVESGELAESRYLSYLNILENMDGKRGM